LLPGVSDRSAAVAANAIEPAIFGSEWTPGPFGEVIVLLPLSKIIHIIIVLKKQG